MYTLIHTMVELHVFDSEGRAIILSIIFCCHRVKYSAQPMAEVHVFYSGRGAMLGTKYMLYFTLLTLYSTAITCTSESLPMADLQVFDSGGRASRSAMLYCPASRTV